MNIIRDIRGAWIAPAFVVSMLAGAARGQTCNAIKVQPDKAPDASTLKTIVDSVTRDCKTNDQKAIAIYNYCMLTHYHLKYPNEPGGIGTLKEIHNYGWSLCGGLHTIESALWIAQGWEHRYVSWNGHTTAEAKYDGKWHYLDIFLKFYAWEPDGKGSKTIASEDDLANQSDVLIKNAFTLDGPRKVVYANDNVCKMQGGKANWMAPEFLACGDTINDVIEGIKTHKVSGPAPGWMTINHDSPNYSTDVSLSPGQALTNTWDPVANAFYWNGGKSSPAHTCPGHKDTRNDPGYGLVLEPYIKSKPARSYGTGFINFTPDFSNPNLVKAFTTVDNVKYHDRALVPAVPGQPAIITIKLASPYIMTKASGAATGADSIEVSNDGGKTFAAADLADFDAAVRDKLEAIVRITIKDKLTAFTLNVIVQNNPGSLPYLSPGKNIVTISVADPKALGDNTLVVTYAYKLGSRSKSLDQLCSNGTAIAQQQSATWSDTVTYVQKTFKAQDLASAKFEIDCPTPKDQFPVYPRMLFLRREVIDPTGKPLPLPDGALEAKPAGIDELATLPNPFLIGTDLLDDDKAALK